MDVSASSKVRSARGASSTRWVQRMPKRGSGSSGTVFFLAWAGIGDSGCCARSLQEAKKTRRSSINTNYGKQSAHKKVKLRAGQTLGRIGLTTHFFRWLGPERLQRSHACGHVFHDVFVVHVHHSSILKLQRLYTSTLRKRSHALELAQRETVVLVLKTQRQ